MKNITLSAPEELIEEARKKAVKNGSTLNDEFRHWLKTQATDHDRSILDYDQMLKHLSHINSGRKFSREEMNER